MEDGFRSRSPIPEVAMRRLPKLLLAGVLAAAGCAEQVQVPAPRPGLETHPNEETWRQEYPEEFKAADKNGDGQLNKAENAAFLDAVQARKQAASTPGPPVARPSPVPPAPNPTVGVMLPPLKDPLDRGPAPVASGPTVGATAPPLPLPGPQVGATDPEATPPGMPIIVVPIPLSPRPPVDPPKPRD